MVAPQRHQLVWLQPDAWRDILQTPAAPWDAIARECLQHWATAGLPLVVARQAEAAAIVRNNETRTLGLPAPARWERRRLALQAATHRVLRTGRFPLVEAIEDLLPPASRAPWRELCRALARLHVAARVYGSFGWQVITRLAYLHADSDIDLLIEVDSTEAADAMMALLAQLSPATPRLDGELLFANGAGVPWREWAAWRNGRVDRVLVKRLYATAVEDPHSWVTA